MNQNEKTIVIAERDRCWADLRENIVNIDAILEGKTELDSMDYILLYQCITIVLSELLLFEEDFLDIDEETERLVKDKSHVSSLMRIIKETGYWKDMINEKLSEEQRIKAIQNLRKSVWANMNSKKEGVIDLQSSYPKIDLQGMHLVIQCAAIVSLELNLRKREIDLLY